MSIHNQDFVSGPYNYTPIGGFGCDGNENNFVTIEDCTQRCTTAEATNKRVITSPEILCKQDAETGVCRGYFEKYFYNASASQCEKFIYGGIYKL